MTRHGFPSFSLCLAFLPALLAAPGAADDLRGSLVLTPASWDLSVALTLEGASAEITLTGPDGRWFAVTFDPSGHEGYTVVVEGDGAVQERDLGNYSSGSLLTSSVDVVGNSVTEGVRTVVLERARTVGTPVYDVFPDTAGPLDLLYARGDPGDSTFQFHAGGNRGAETLDLALLTLFADGFESGDTGAWTEGRNADDSNASSESPAIPIVARR